MAIALGILLLLLTPVLDTVAQVVQVPPIQQPIQQLPTEEPDDRPGEIPTIDPDSDLPPRPTQVPPTELPTRPPRVTPTAEPTEVPVEPTAAPTLESQALEIAAPHVTIHKGLCENEIADDSPFDPYGDASLDDFQAECDMPQEPVEFTVTGEDGFSETVATANGEAQLDVTATKIGITETIPSGYAYPAVFCYSNQLSPIADTPAAFKPTASWTMHPGESLDCWFFNIPIMERAAVTVFKLECPDGASPLSDQLDPFTYCTTEVPGIEFTMTDANGPRTETTDEDGAASWDDTIIRDDDTIEIRETIPDGYGEPAFFCGPRDDNPGDGLYIPSVDGAITLPLTNVGQHANVVCVVFNTTAGAEAGHDVTILKYACPFGYDNTGKPIETILDECDKHPGIVEFTVAGEGGFSVTEQTISPDVPFALFDNVPAGAITITETVPPGYAALAAWCSDEVANDTLTNIQSQPLVNGNSIAWDYADDSNLSCVWLNIPTEQPAGDNQVIVHKWRCNIEDLGAYDTDWALDEYHAVCDEPMDGVDFTLTAPNGIFPQTTANGAVEWTGQPEGAFAIQETLPAGYGDPIVFCSIQIPNGGGPMVRVDAPGGLVEASFGVPGSTYTCEWFNVDMGPNSMRFWKHVCPDDVLMGQDLAYYEATCTLPQPNVDFTVTTANGAMTGATNFGGVVVFQPVPGGDVAIQETIPTGYGSPLVYCNVTVYDGSPAGPFAPVSSPGGLANVTMPPLGHIDCHWFNIADAGDGTVIIHKWECPEKPAKGTIVTWYPQNCTQAMDGVDFTLETVTGNSTGATVNGAVTFQGVPAGPVGIQESIPAGFGEPHVSCDLDGAPVLESAVNGHYATAIGSGQTLTCHWYNVPGGPGDLTFIKHTCAAGYDPFAANADPYLDCPELTNGVEFTLSGPADAVSTTGDVDPGTAYFGPLDPGTYTVTETVPAGTAQVFVLNCTGYIMGQLQPYPLSQDESLDIAVDAGEHLTCHWFNVPEEDGGTVTLTKYTCAGEAFVSEVDCEIFEDGVTFDLLASDDSVVATATTDGFGRITWTGLTPGDYWLDEHDGEWCHIAATPAEGGDSFGVNDGQETTVKVYNCGDTPGQPGDTPTKYPNTGAGPGGTAPQAMAFSQTAPIQVSAGDIVVFDEDGRIVRVIEEPTPLDRLILVLQAIPAWVYVLTVIVVVAVVIKDRQDRAELPELEARMTAPSFDRPLWLGEATNDRPADRPAWFTGAPAPPPSDRPAWMNSSPEGKRP